MGFVIAWALVSFVSTEPVLAQAAAGTLVFQSDRSGNWDIFRVEADGSGLVQLTDDPSDDSNPAWSPDGTRIAFSSTRSGAGDIYVMNADGGELERLTDHRAYEGAPRWSPDGGSLLFEAEREGVSQIYRLDIDRRRSVRLTDSATRKLGPVYAPDAQSIVFMELGPAGWRLTLMDWESWGTQSLTEGASSCRPAFSPDGSMLAYVSSRAREKADVWLRQMGRQGEPVAWRVPTRPDAYNYDPSFSPDGRTLAIASTRVRGEQEDWDLFLVDVNGRGLMALTGDEGNDRFPDWRPR